MKNVSFLSDAHLGSLAIDHGRMHERRLVRFLGKLSELSDLGVEIHYFTGNHDIWAYNYLEHECGVILHTQPLTTEIYGKIFFLAHGDGLGDPDKKFKLLRAFFHNRFCQVMFSTIHPRWSIWFGMQWAKHSRQKHMKEEEPTYMGEDKEHLVLYTKEYIQYHPNVDYFIYGHRHIELDLQLTKKARMIILGDWITQFTYAVFDGEHMFLSEYIEGESRP